MIIDCDEAFEDKQSYDDLTLMTISVSLVCTVAIGVVTLATTYIVYCRRKADQRPFHVKAQLYFLNVFWMAFVVYYAMLLDLSVDEDKRSRLDDWTLNMIASISDLMLIMSDYIYFEMYFSASLTLPIILNFYTDDSVY